MGTHRQVAQGLNGAATRLLNGAGHDTVTVSEEGLSRHPDSAVAAISTREERVLMSLDVDFANIRTYPTGGHASMMVLHPHGQDRDAVISVVQQPVLQFFREPVYGEAGDRRRSADPDS